MQYSDKNIVLIGMPGSGKSTVGEALAKCIAFDFTDTDLLIENKVKQSLRGFVNRCGYMALRAIEEQILCQLCLDRHIISTGGSAVYSDKGMKHLKSGALCIYLDEDINVLNKRISDYSGRGIANDREQNLASIFRERKPLYSKYADLTIDCSCLTVDQICKKIMFAILPNGQ